ncbi:MAG: orotate phosphoribosyltransferase [Clostridium sp.]|nr:orotate phosphoribosyltransferase [Clostridium sp.]
MDIKYTKIQAAGCSAPLKITPGHFATNHAHINYYIDMATLKTRLSEAQEIARSLVGMFLYDTIVDTIVCLEGTQVIGSFLAEELTGAGVLSMNAHKTMYIVTPEYNSNSQMIFKENILPMIRGKNVIILTASVTTGLALNKGIESIQYYGGILRGISAIFSAVEEVNGFRVASIFGKKDLPDYAYFDYRTCPLCREGRKLDALVNAYGYTQL